MKKVIILLILLAPVLLGGCMGQKAEEAKVEKEQVMDSQDNTAFETGEVQIQTESTGNIDRDIEEIDNLMKLDEADTGEENDISDENLEI